MVQIIPAILTNDPKEALELLHLAEKVVERVQIDVIDGIFADNKTVDPIVFQEAETALKIDFHLMVKEPINWVEKCVNAGADRIIGHIEQMSNIQEFLEKIHALNVTPGLGVDLDTPLIELDQALLSQVGVVIVMSTKAGFGGQEFQQSVLEKISQLNAIREEHGYLFKICDDGGVTLNWADDLRRKGTDEIAIGKRVFIGDLAENVTQLQEAAK